jgi:endonuclease/exonuclease/phosphatase family metal-dependent hydrolase
VAALSLLSLNLQAGAQTDGLHDYWRKAWHQVLPHPSKHRALSAVAKLASEVDVLGLQEADRGSLRAGFVDQSRFIAEAAEFPHVHAQANREFGWLFSSGNSILTRAPGTARALRLPGLLPARIDPMGRSDSMNDKRSLRSGRGALSWQNAELTLVNVHLALLATVRMKQLRFLAEDLGPARERTIVFGDFNALASSPEVREFCARCGLQAAELSPTFPSWAPKHAIDLMLYTPDLRLRSARVHPEMASDHLPISAHFEW